MPARLLPVLAAALLTLVFAACGGNSEDPNAVLEETFSGDKEITSGRLQLDLSADVKGTGRVQGPVSLKLDGPFDKDGDNMPQFDLEGTVAGNGMTYEVGAASTGEKGFVLFETEEYVLAQQTFEHFKRSYDRAQRKHAGKNAAGELAALGIDPRKWLRNLQNEGQADVGGVETIKITGDVDVAQLLDDLGKAKARGDDEKSKRDPDDRHGRSSGEHKRELAQAVKSARVELYTGKDDKILRRIFFDADVVAPAGEEDFESADVKFDYSILEVNEPQKITEPAEARPFNELADQLRGLGLGVGRSTSDGRTTR